MIRLAALVSCLVQGLASLGISDLREAPESLAKATTIANFPTGTFLENLITLPNGDLIVTSHLEHALYRVGLSGTRKRFTTLPGKIAGVAPDGEGGYVVSGWNKDGKGCIYEVTDHGKLRRTVLISGGMFPNGIIPIRGHQFLIADSYAGSIWLYSRSSHQARLWLKDRAFDRADLKNGTPGINGIRLHGSTLYFSNTNAQFFGKVPLSAAISPIGKVEIVTKGVNFDDFAVDQSGNVFATTHILNSVQKLTPAGKLTTIAALPQGMAGSTSVAFGKSQSTRNSLFVATNGGLSAPPRGGIQNGKIVRIDF